MSSYSLESIFAIDQSSTLVNDFKDVMIHLEFASNPSSFTVMGITLDILNSDQMLSFLVKILQVMFDNRVYYFCSNDHQGSGRVAINLLLPYVTTLRSQLCPSTTNFIYIRKWDKDFIDVLFSVILNSQSYPTWKRICRQVMLNDLGTTPNFDGSQGIIRAIQRIILQFTDAIHDGSISRIKDLMNEAEHLSCWISPRCITLSALGAWSLLHLAVSNTTHSEELYMYLVDTMGCSISAVDSRGQSALHVAASHLNYTAVLWICKVSPTAHKATDYQGRTALELLLHTLSVCCWSKKLLSPNLQRMVVALLPPSHSDIIWKRSYNVLESTQKDNAYHKVASARSSLFCIAVTSSDDYVSEEVIKRARSTDIAKWDAEAVREAVFRCIRSRARRCDTVAVLMRELVAPLIERNSFLECKAAFLDECLCHAVTSHQGRTQGSALAFLLEQVVLLCREGRDEFTTFGVFFLVAVVRQNPSLLTAILTLLPKDIVKILIYPTSATTSLNIASTSTCHSTKANTTNTTGCNNTAKVYNLPLLWKFCYISKDHRLAAALESLHLTPLSLACALNSPDTVHILLRASYIPPTIRTLNGVDVVTQSEYDHLYPIYYSALSGASSCLQALRNIFSNDSFYKICFIMQVPEGRSVFCSLVRRMGCLTATTTAAAVAPDILCSPDGTADFKAYSDCLKLLLDCLPLSSSSIVTPTTASTDATPTANPSTASLLVGNNDNTLPCFIGESNRVIHALQNRINVIQEEIIALLRLNKEEYKLFYEQNNTISETLSPAELDIESVSLWTVFIREKERIIHNLRAKYFLTNLRLLGKRGRPDKKWTKLAYCLMRVFRVLQLQCVGSSSTVVDDHIAEDLPDSIDTTEWNRFLSMTVKLSKATAALEEFTGTLSASLEQIFTHPLLHNTSSSSSSRSCIQQLYTTDIIVELEKIANILTNNQITILLHKHQQHSAVYTHNTKSSTSHTTGIESTPHYQTSILHSNERNDNLYKSLYNWLNCILNAVKMRQSFETKTIKYAVNRSSSGSSISSITVLDYIHYRQLLQETKKLEYLLYCAKGSSSTCTPMKLTPLHIFIHSTTTPASSTESTYNTVLNLLQSTLRHSGILSYNPPNLLIVEKERKKQHNIRYIEQIACVLIEYNVHFGGNIESIVSLLLPLCVMQCWKAAELLLDMCAHAKAVVNMESVLQQLFQVRAGTSLYCNNSSSTGSSVLGQTKPTENYQLASHTNNSASVNVDMSALMVICPLHYAIMHRRRTFIQKFLTTFTHAPLDLLAIIRFALSIHASDMIAVIVSYSCYLQSTLFATDAYDLPIMGVINSPAPWQLVQEHMTNELSARRNDINQQRGSEFLCLVVAAVAEARLISHNKPRNSSGIHKNPLFVVKSSSDGSEGAQVCLMDGSHAPWEEVVADAQLMALAMPAPQYTGGLFGTGHTVLHQVTRSTYVHLLEEMTLLNPSLLSQWLSIDCTGRTPLYNLLKSGNLLIAQRVLQQLTAHRQTNNVMSLDEYYLTSSLPDTSSSAADSLRRQIMSTATAHLHSLENKFHVSRINHRDEPRRGLSRSCYSSRGYQVENCTHLLSRCLEGIEILWRRIVNTDAQILLQVCHLPACAQLDSIIRARQVLTLLGIPLSQLAIPSLQLQTSTTTNTNPHTNTRSTREFLRLSPRKLRKMVSWPAAQQLKHILVGWYRQRCSSNPSQLDDSFFLFRNIDISIEEIGYSGSEISTYIRQHTSYIHAVDHVRRYGIGVNEKAQTFGTLCQQMKLEFRFDLSATIRENIPRSSSNNNRNTINTGTTTGASVSARVLNLLQTMEIDAKTCCRSLSLAYTILDFCRAVCIARHLVSITTLPIQNQNLAAESIHPLDTLYEDIHTARVHVNQLKGILYDTVDSYEEDTKAAIVKQTDMTIERYETDMKVPTVNPSGILSRIKLCDQLTASEMDDFFTVKAGVSQKFAELREFVVQGISSLLLDLGELRLSEFICRLLSHPDSRTSDANTSNNSTIQVNAINASYTRNTHDTPSYTSSSTSKYSRITDKNEGINKLLQFIQHLHVKDLLQSGSKTSQFLYKYKDKIKLLNKRNNSELKLNKNEIIIPTNTNTQSLLEEKVLKERNSTVLDSSIVAYTMKSKQERIVAQSLAYTEEKLTSAYRVCTALYRILATATHLPHESGTYSSDIACCMQLIHIRSPMYALCLPSLKAIIQSSSQPHIHIPVRGSHSQRATYRREEEGWRLLIGLGTSPTLSVDQAFTPLELAALAGRADLLLPCLEHTTISNINNTPSTDVAKDGMSGVKSLPHYTTLIWYVLLISALTQKNRNASLQDGYYQCVKLLLLHNFPTTAPIQCDFSCLEIALYVNAPLEVLSELVTRRVPMSTASQYRALWIALLYTSVLPSELGEALLFGVSEPVLESFLAKSVSLREVLSSEGFQVSVLQHTADTLTDALNCCGETSIDMTGIKHLLSVKLGGTLKALSSSSRRRATLVQKDFSAAICSLVDTINESAHTECACLLELLASSKQQELATVVMHRLTSTISSRVSVVLDSDRFQISLAMNEKEDQEGTHSSVSMLQLLCSACFSDSVAMLTSLRTVWTTFSSSSSAVSTATATSILHNEQDDPIDEDSVVHQPQQLDWVNVLSRKGYCAELKRLCTPLEAAIHGHATTCVNYLCSQGVPVLCSQIVSAISKAQIGDTTALQLLQCAVPSKEDMTIVCLEYDSIDAFLSTHHHNSADTTETILHLCCRRGFVKTIEYLLQLGGNPLQQDIHNYSVLTTSIATGNNMITRIIYSYCTEYIKHAVNILVYACRKFLLRLYRKKI